MNPRLRNKQSANAPRQRVEGIGAPAADTRWRALITGAATIGFLGLSVTLVPPGFWTALWPGAITAGFVSVSVGSYLAFIHASTVSFGAHRRPYPMYLWTRLSGAVAPLGVALGIIGLMWRSQLSDIGTVASWLAPAFGFAGICATPFLASLLWGLLVDVPQKRAAGSAQPS